MTLTAVLLILFKPEIIWVDAVKKEKVRIY